MALQPLPQYFRKPYQDMSGGKCTRPDAQRVPANKFVQLDNAILAEHDILEKAPGYIVDGSPFPNSTDSFIRMLVNYRVGSSVNSIVCAAQDNGNTNASFKVDFKQTFGDGNYNYIGYTAGTATFTNASTSVTGSGTAWLTNLKGGDKIKPNSHANWYEIQSVTNDTTLVLTANYTDATVTGGAYMARVIASINARPSGLVFNQKLVLVDGVDAMAEFDNTSVLRLTGFNSAFSSPAAPYCIDKHKNRVFVANATNLYWSKVNDETAWDAGSSEPIFPSDDGNAVAIKSFANSILVFKDNGLIYKVSGEFDQDVVGAPTSIVLMNVPDNLGIIAGKSVVIHDDGKLYFTCETGVYSIDPWYLQFKKESWDIQPDIAKLIFKSNPTANKQFSFASQAQWNTGTLVGTKVDGSNRITTYNDRLAILNTVKPVTSFSGQGLTAGAACATDSSNNSHIVYISSANGGTLSYCKYSADGTNLQEDIISSPMPGASFSRPLSTDSAYLAIDVAANGNIGVVLVYDDFNGNFIVQNNANSFIVYYFERIAIGSASFTSGSNAVTGLGTSWNTGPYVIAANSLIKNSVDNSFAKVSTVNSDTGITLTAPYSGTTSMSSSYVIWALPVTIVKNVWSINTPYTAGGAADIKFNSNEPVIVSIFSNANPSGLSPVTAITGYSRSGRAFSSGTAVNYTQVLNCVCRISVAVSGANVYVSGTFENTTIHALSSSNGGSTFSSIENFSVSLSSADGIQSALNGGGNFITSYGSVGAIKKRNHSTATTTTLDATANSHFGGYIFFGGNDYVFNIVGSSPAQVEKYLFLASSTVSDSLANRLDSLAFMSKGLSNNGPVFTSVACGTNSGELVIRRISFTGTWTSAVTTDSTLSSWGTCAISGEFDNGATVLKQIALGTTSSVGAPASIADGQLVSTNPAKIFFQFTVTMTITALSAPVIGSIVLNYIGAGADGKTPYGFVFNNEMYLSGTEPGQSANNVVQFLDRNGAWGDTSLAVTQFARMNQTLYAGSSLNGDVLKLKRGLNFGGSAYTLTAITKEDMLGSLELRKEVSKAYVLYRVQSSGTFTFSYRLDNYKTNGGSAWTDVVVDQTAIRSDLGGIEIPIQKICSSIQFKITQASANVQIGFIGFDVLYGYTSLR